MEPSPWSASSSSPASSSANVGVLGAVVEAVCTVQSRWSMAEIIIADGMPWGCWVP